jgi:cytochrome P450
MSVIFDPWDYDWHADPYPLYAALRESAPLYHNPNLDFWALSRHSDVKEAFRDSTRFSSADGVTLDVSASGPHARKAMSFLAMDPPDHAVLRGMVSRAFTVRRVAELEQRIREITLEHLEPAIESNSFDFIADVAGKIPMDVISEVLGVPASDRAELRRLADLVLHREAGLRDVSPSSFGASLTLVSYYQDMVIQRRDRPGGDLVSALCAGPAENRLSDEDIIAFLFLMVVAGNETTTKLLGNCWYWGWKVRDQGRKAFLDPGAIPRWVEETLRFDTSSHVLARTTTTSVDLHGDTIPPGSRVVLLPASANRDPRVFRDADVYDLERDTSELLSFGLGRHFCLGASMARLETRIVLEELVRRVADYDISEPDCSRVHSSNVLGFTAIPTKIEVRRTAAQA